MAQDNYIKSQIQGSHTKFYWRLSIYILPMTTFGEGNGNPLQYSCLENPKDGGAWQATVHGVAESWTQLNSFTFMTTFTP